MMIHTYISNVIEPKFRTTYFNAMTLNLMSEPQTTGHSRNQHKIPQATGYSRYPHKKCLATTWNQVTWNSSYLHKSVTRVSKQLYTPPSAIRKRFSNLIFAYYACILAYYACTDWGVQISACPCPETARVALLKAIWGCFVLNTHSLAYSTFLYNPNFQNPFTLRKLEKLHWSYMMSAF